MDRIAVREKAKSLLEKYKYVALIITVGVVLMAFPAGDETEEIVTATEQTAAAYDPEEELAQILSQIKGVGKVSVMLTEAAGAQTVYQTDEDSSESDGSRSVKVETVIVTDNSRGQTGLVKTVSPPVYLGAIVVCQGADSASVRLSVVEAVSNVTGISSDRIAVLKMK